MKKTNLEQIIQAIIKEVEHQKESSNSKAEQERRIAGLKGALNFLKSFSFAPPPQKHEVIGFLKEFNEINTLVKTYNENKKANCAPDKLLFDIIVEKRQELNLKSKALLSWLQSPIKGIKHLDILDTRINCRSCKRSSFLSDWREATKAEIESGETNDINFTGEDIEEVFNEASFNCPHCAEISELTSSIID